MNEFDRGIERRGTNCVKWDVPFVTEDVLPMWIADMDFEVAPGVQKKLLEAAGQGAFGYQFLSEAYYEAVIGWMKKRHGLPLAKEEICYVPNVVLGLQFAVCAISEPGDEILVQPPVYGPFFGVVSGCGRVLVESPLNNKDGYYTMDLEDLEKKITPKTKAILICNPHNPSGRVWTRQELSGLTDICLKHGLYMISDDIHCELTMGEHKHTFISELSEEARSRSIIFTSPSKAFNLASVHVANGFIFDGEVRERFQKLAEESHAAECNAFSESALRGAYEDSAGWLDSVCQYIDKNIEVFTEIIHDEIPALTVYRPEGTYLVWVDFRRTAVPAGELKDFLLEECKVAVNDGIFFGKAGEGFARFNLACPRSRVVEAAERLKKVFAGEATCQKKR